MTRKDNPLLERANDNEYDQTHSFWDGVWLGLLCWVLALMLVGGMLV